jgi:sodium/potassium-transporting ATPase subunit alpha
MELSTKGSKTFFHVGDDWVLSSKFGGALFERDEFGLPNCYTQGGVVVSSTERTDPKQVVTASDAPDGQKYVFYIPYGSYTIDGQERTDKATHNTLCSFDTKSTVVDVRSGLPNQWAGKGGRQMPDAVAAPVCHSVDALKFAQTGFLIAIIIVQFSNLWFCKTRKLSLLQQGLVNQFQNMSICSEFGLGALLCYAEFCHVVFNTRALVGWHFAVPGMPFAIYEFVFDEARKYLLRQGDPDAARLGKLTLNEDGMHYWVYTHTYY